MGGTVSTIRHVGTVLNGPIPVSGEEALMFGTSLACPGLWVSNHADAATPRGYDDLSSTFGNVLHPDVRGIARTIALKPRSPTHGILGEALFRVRLEAGFGRFTADRLGRLFAFSRGTKEIGLMLFLGQAQILNLNTPVPIDLVYLSSRGEPDEHPEMGHVAHLLAARGNAGNHPDDKPISLTECFKLLKKLARDTLEMRAQNGRTPLHEAVIAGNHKTLRAILRAGVNVDAPDGEGHTALGRAQAARDVEAVMMLRAAGARVDWVGAPPPMSSSQWAAQQAAQRRPR